MPELIVDSSIVIDYLRGHAGAAEFMERARQAGELATHVVVAAEVFAGARDQRELNIIEGLIGQFRVHPIDASDSVGSLDLFKRHRLAHGVGWLDCLIAATALRLQLPIATLNEKHFAVFPDLPVVRPY
jgi:predicted nucleic acid-binding protein